MSFLAGIQRLTIDGISWSQGQIQERLSLFLTGAGFWAADPLAGTLALDLSAVTEASLDYYRFGGAPAQTFSNQPLTIVPEPSCPLLAALAGAGLALRRYRPARRYLVRTDR